MPPPAPDKPSPSGSGRPQPAQLERGYGRIGLKTRFTLYLTTLIVALMAIVALLVEKRMGETIARQAEKRGLSIARNLAAVCQPSLVTYNYVALTQNAERAKLQEEGIAEVIILDKEGKVAAYSGHGERQGTLLTDPVSVQASLARHELVLPVTIERDDASSTRERGLDISVPVFIENSDEKWGTVRIRLLTEDMHRQIRDTRLTLLVAGLMAVGLGALGAWLMARRITGPVAQLVGGTIQAAAGRLETRIDIRTGDEIEELAQNFNEMVRQVETNQRAVEGLNRNLERRSRELHDLHEVGLRLAAAADAESVLALAVDAALTISGARWVAAVAQVGRCTARWAGSREALALDAQKALEAHLARAASRENPPLPPFVRAIPLEHAQSLLGFLLLGEAPEPSPDGSDLLSILAGQCGARLDNLRLLEGRLESERLSAVGRMISNIVHDFRNPMTAMKGYGGMLAELELPPERCREYAQLIVDEADRLSGMADEIMEFTRGEHTPPRLAPTTVAELAARLERQIAGELRARGLSLRTELEYAGALLADADRLRRALLNVAMNALEAMPRGGTLTLASRLRDGRVEISLRDTGPGIPAELQPRVFEPFFTHGKPRGVGLGMAITRKIVEEHAGDILLESQPGQGSCFTLRLPVP